MQINRAENTDIKALAQGAAEKPPKATANTGGKDSLSVDTAGFVAKALQLRTDEASSAATVEAAKALIATGQIDKPEIIREAATSIIARGV